MIKDKQTEGDQSWVFFGRNDAKAETPVLWSPHVKSWLIGKDPDVGRGWGQEGKGMTEDEMAGWHHQLYANESGWTPGVGDEQGGLACCNSWGHKESDTTEWLNWFAETLPFDGPRWHWWSFRLAMSGMLGFVLENNGLHIIISFLSCYIFRYN